MEQILFKNDTGSKLALNIIYWLRDGGANKIGGKPAALRAILDKYTRAGFMVQADGWSEFCELMNKAAKVDGKGSQAAEKAAILKAYNADGKGADGYIYLIKEKKAEGSKMKKVIMYWKKNGKEQPEITATLDPESGAAYYKDPESGLYIALDYASGLKIGEGKTRKAAAAFVADHMVQIENIRKSDKYAAGIINGKTEPETVQEEKQTEQPEIKTEEQTEKEIREKLTAEITAGDFSSICGMLATRKDNKAAIIIAGINAGVFTADEMMLYVFTGKMPAVHTFDAWKERGRIVRKGEKAAFAAYIWKYTADKKKDAEPETETDAETIPAGPDYIRKNAYFFREEQTEPAPVYKDLEAIPDGCKMEVVKGVKWISGDTRKHKETLKAAGYRWSNKRGAWYRF